MMLSKRGESKVIAGDSESFSSARSAFAAAAVLPAADDEPALKKWLLQRWSAKEAALAKRGAVSAGCCTSCCGYRKYKAWAEAKKANSAAIIKFHDVSKEPAKAEEGAPGSDVGTAP